MNPDEGQFDMVIPSPLQGDGPDVQYEVTIHYRRITEPTTGGASLPISDEPAESRDRKPFLVQLSADSASVVHALRDTLKVPTARIFLYAIAHDPNTLRDLVRQRRREHWMASGRPVITLTGAAPEDHPVTESKDCRGISARLTAAERERFDAALRYSGAHTYRELLETALPVLGERIRTDQGK